MDKPSEWAGSVMTNGCTCGQCSWCDGLQAAVAAALTSAHEAGRKVGLEEAAEVCDYRARVLRQGEAAACADAIRVAGEVTRG